MAEKIQPADVRALARIKLIAHWRPVAARFRRMAAQAPEKSKVAMGHAVSWWTTISKQHMPMSGSAKVHGGRLRQATQPYVNVDGSQILGGVMMRTPYAIWLVAGTRHIAGGRLLRWKPGDAPITSWPAKTEHGPAAALLPVALPWQVQARTKLKEYLIPMLLRK